MGPQRLRIPALGSARHRQSQRTFSPPPNHHLLQVKLVRLCARKRGCGSHNFRCGGARMRAHARDTAHMPPSCEQTTAACVGPSDVMLPGAPVCVCVFVFVCVISPAPCYLLWPRSCFFFFFSCFCLHVRTPRPPPHTHSRHTHLLLLSCGKLRVCFLRSTRSVQIFCQRGPWRGAVGDPAAPLLAGPRQCGCGRERAPTVWAVSPRPILYKQIAQRACVKALQIPGMVL